MNWYDSDGGLHLRPNPDLEQSENSPLFSGTEICLKYELGKLTLNDCERFIEFCLKLYRQTEGRWYTTSVSRRKRFSHDNYTGVLTGLKCCERWLETHKNGGLDYQVLLNESKWLQSKVPIFHKHPRDLIYLNRVRHPLPTALFMTSLGVCFGHLCSIIIAHIRFLPDFVIVLNYIFCAILFAHIDSIAMIVSCWQTHKVRGGRKIIKTDGKILTFIRCIAMPMPITWLVCNWLVLKRKRVTDHTVFKWSSWFTVFNTYYRLTEHPNVQLVRELERKIH